MLYFIGWGTHLKMLLFQSLHPFVCLSIFHASYLKNCRSYDHYFWYMCLKLWYLQALISFLVGEKAKNDPKWQKILSVAPYIAGAIYPMILFYGTHECIKGYLRAFFSFLGFLRGEVSKRAKHDLKLLISVCFALYLRNCRSCHQDDHNGISRCFQFCFIIFF